MNRLTELDVKTFLDVLASDAPAPGGGSASALFGACGAALGAMTTNLTIGRKKYADLWESAEIAKAEGLQLKNAFTEVLEADTAAFDRVMEALHLPKDTDAQKAARRDAIEEATKGAVRPPYRMLELCDRAAALLDSLPGRVNPNCASDLGVAAAAVGAAAKGAWLNACINLQSLRDDAYVAETVSSGKALLNSVLMRTQAIYSAIEAEVLPD